MRNPATAWAEIEFSTAHPKIYSVRAKAAFGVFEGWEFHSRSRETKATGEHEGM